MYGGGPPVPRRDIASWTMSSAERERLMTAIGKPPIQVTGMPCAAENASVARPEEAASESALQTCVMALSKAASTAQRLQITDHGAVSVYDTAGAVRLD